MTHLVLCEHTEKHGEKNGDSHCLKVTVFHLPQTLILNAPLSLKQCTRYHLL